MTDSIVIRIDGKPVPKGRPRFTTRGGYARSYTPKKTRDHERLVGLIARRHFKKPLTCPLKLSVYFYLKPPKSWSKKKKERAIKGEILPTARPDLDNYLKAIKDGIDGIACKDDAQFTDYGEVRKRYAKEDYTVIVIQPIEAETAY